MTGGSPTRWFVVNGDQVSVGDHVATDIDPGVNGEIIRVSRDHGLPVVRLTTGDRKGDEVMLWPGQILRKITNRSG